MRTTLRGKGVVRLGSGQGTIPSRLASFNTRSSRSCLPRRRLAPGADLSVEDDGAVVDRHPDATSVNLSLPVQGCSDLVHHALFCRRLLMVMQLETPMAPVRSLTCLLAGSAW